MTDTSPDTTVAYKKDQGRYARMAAFWGLFLLFAYGCLGGMVYTLRGWLKMQPKDAWVEPFPLLDRLDLATVISLAVLVACGVLVQRLLNQPRTADLLIDTESELRKVSWPSATDTWAGTIAVVLTVVFLLLYLTGADVLIAIALEYVVGSS